MRTDFRQVGNGLHRFTGHFASRHSYYVKFANTAHVRRFFVFFFFLRWRNSRLLGRLSGHCVTHDTLDINNVHDKPKFKSTLTDNNTVHNF